MGDRLLRTLVWLSLGAVVLGALLTVPVRHLTEPDEARYAEVAREMLESGRWLVPRLHGEPYTHKPPLFLWSVAALRWLGVGWTAAAVMPALAAFFLTMLTLPRLGLRLGFHREECALAVALLASTPFFSILALVGRMDMVLVAVHTAALAALAALLDPQQLGGRPWWHHLAFWTAVGLGVLVKGPVALALAVVTALVWSAAAGGRPFLQRVFVGWGPLLGLGIVVAWLIPATLAGGRDWFEEVAVYQSAGRVVNSFAHREPFYYHLLTYPITGLPWTPFVVAGLLGAARGGAVRGQKLAAAAVGAGLLFFSLLSGKVVIYLLPLFPVAALLAARTIRSRPVLRRGLPTLAGAGIVLFGLATFLLPHLRLEVQGAALPLGAVGAILIVLGAATALLAGQPQRWLASAVLGGALVLAAAFPVAVRSADRALSAFEIAATVQRLEPHAPDVLTVDLALFGVSLYAERLPRPLLTKQELQAALQDGRLVVAHRDSARLRRPSRQVVPLRELETGFQREPAVILVPVPAPQGR